jgi:hypothetical protein
MLGKGVGLWPHPLVVLLAGATSSFIPHSVPFVSQPFVTAKVGAAKTVSATTAVRRSECRRCQGGILIPLGSSRPRWAEVSGRYEARRKRECWSVQEHLHLRHRQSTPPLVGEGHLRPTSARLPTHSPGKYETLRGLSFADLRLGG